MSYLSFASSGLCGSLSCLWVVERVGNLLAKSSDVLLIGITLDVGSSVFIGKSKSKFKFNLKRGFSGYGFNVGLLVLVLGGLVQHAHELYTVRVQISKELLVARKGRLAGEEVHVAANILHGLGLSSTASWELLWGRCVYACCHGPPNWESAFNKAHCKVVRVEVAGGR